MDAQVIVVGSGPSGVSAAWPLVEAGHKVMLLDQGRFDATKWHHEGTLLDMRQTDQEQWKMFFGSDFSGIDINAEKQSPKFKVPAHRYVHNIDGLSFDIESRGIYPTLSLARGGISGMWGAGAFTYEDYDLLGFPINRNALSDSYRRVASRIGISGTDTDGISSDLGDDIPLQPPVDMHPAAAKLLSRYEKHTSPSENFKLGLTRNAVTTSERRQLMNKTLV